MKKFRLPRKIKKKFKRGIYLYPEKDGGSLMAHPKRSQKDYDAFKQGIVRDAFKKTKSQQKADSIEWKKKFRTPNELTDEELINAVNDVFAEQYRKEAIRVFRLAKTHPIAKDDYYTFVNAYKLVEEGERYGNTCCMAFDFAKEDLNRTKPRKLK